MFFQHVYDKTLAQASYFIGCQAKGEAIVIDAQRDIDIYLSIAKQNNFKITHIAEYICRNNRNAQYSHSFCYLFHIKLPGLF